MNRLMCVMLACAFGALMGPVEGDDPKDELLRTLLSASETQPGDASIAAAWQQVARWEMSRLPEVIQAMDHANPVARNWLRGAVDGILEDNRADLPIAVLEAIAADSTRGLPSRRVALELLESADPQAVERLVPRFLNDPLESFRRPAVAQLIAQADALQQQPSAQKELLWKAFHAARAEDQVMAIAKSLTDLGETVDVATHFGFIRKWYVVGPFENKEMAGFDQPYPPERLALADFDADGRPIAEGPVTGIDGPLHWQLVTVKPETGEVDLNIVFGKRKGVLAYGAAVFQSERARSAELRLRLQNPFKIWVNGQLVQSQRVGHTGNLFDQYKVPIELRQGPNLIVVKSCQPEPPQENEWYDTWHWSVRVCDSTGTAILEGK